VDITLERCAGVRRAQKSVMACVRTLEPVGGLATAGPGIRDILDYLQARATGSPWTVNVVTMA